MSPRYRGSVPALIWKNRPQKSIIAADDPIKDFKTIADYIYSQYDKHNISKDLYGKLLSFITPLYLERMMENKFNEMISIWSRSFSRRFYPKLKELVVEE